MDWQTALSNHSDLAHALDSCIETLEMSLADEPSIIFVFVSIHHQASWSLVGPVLLKRFQGCQVIGCCGAGIIGGSHEVEQGPALTLAGAVLPGVDLKTFHFNDSDDGTDREVERQMLLDLADGELPQAMMLLPDPFSCNVKSFLRMADTVYPKTSIFGGIASGGREPGQHALFSNDKIYKSGCVGVTLTGNLRVESIISQGCRPIGPPLFVTRATEHTIHELDGMPALDAVERVCKALPPEELALARKALYLGLAMEPHAQSYGPGDFLVRDLVGAMPEGRALLVAARVETQSVVQFHVRDARSAWSELDDLLKKSAEGERQPAGALMFSCVGRGQRLYGEVGHDSRVVWQHFDALSLTGFFGNGEIGQVGGRTWVHGYTTAIILFRPGSDA